MRTGHIRTLQLGFRLPDNAAWQELDTAGYEPPIEWTSEHNEPDYNSIPAESLILTGDEVPVELTAELHYRVGDLYAYLNGSAQPEATLRVLMESAIRQIASQQTLSGLLTDEREKIEQQALAMIRTQGEEYGLGLELLDLHLLDLHPPRTVVPAYREVANALEEQQQQINTANAYLISRLNSAIGERAMEFLFPQSTRSTAEIPLSELEQWELTEEVWNRLTQQREGDLLSGQVAATFSEARTKATQRRTSAQAEKNRYSSLWKVYREQPELTVHQVYWDMIEETLSGRPLTIVDPTVTARQHLLMIDPADFRSMPFVPMLPQPSTPPTEPNENEPTTE